MTDHTVILHYTDDASEDPGTVHDLGQTCPICLTEPSPSPEQRAEPSLVYDGISLTTREQAIYNEGWNEGQKAGCDLASPLIPATTGHQYRGPDHEYIMGFKDGVSHVKRLQLQAAEHHELRLTTSLARDGYVAYCPCGWTTYRPTWGTIRSTYRQHLPNRFAHEPTETDA